MRIRPMMGAATLLGLSLAWCGCCTWFSPLHAQATEKASRCYRLGIEGMSCEHCTGHVKKALLEVPGVAEAKVAYATAEAEVCIKPGFAVTGKTLVQAVQKAGYKAKVKWQSQE
jgi:copper chaperone CopZ